MSNVIPIRPDVLATMSPDAIDAIRRYEQVVLEAPQVDIVTYHVLHAGLYARTIIVPAGVTITSALIKRSTLLVVDGKVSIGKGDGDAEEISGFAILAARGGRKLAYVAHTDTTITMLFATSAKTVEEAEAEFTDDADRLMSRYGRNEVTITGD